MLKAVYFHKGCSKAAFLFCADYQGEYIGDLRRIRLDKAKGLTCCSCKQLIENQKLDLEIFFIHRR